MLGYKWRLALTTSRSMYTNAAKVLILRPDKQSYQALQENRKRQETPEFRALYAKRAGVEGTVAQAVRTCKIRRSRYIGQKKLNL